MLVCVPIMMCLQKRQQPVGTGARRGVARTFALCSIYRYSATKTLEPGRTCQNARPFSAAAAASSYMYIHSIAARELPGRGDQYSGGRAQLRGAFAPSKHPECSLADAGNFQKSMPSRAQPPFKFMPRRVAQIHCGPLEAGHGIFPAKTASAHRHVNIKDVALERSRSSGAALAARSAI